MQPPEKILIIKPSSLGDVISAVPVLHGLRRSFPNAHITWLISNTCADAIKYDSALNETILFNRRRLGAAWRNPGALADLLKFLKKLRNERFDFVIDLQGLLRSGFFAFISGAPVRIGFADAREGAKFFYTRSFIPTAAHVIDQNMELANSVGIDARPEDFYLSISPEATAFADDFCRRNSVSKGGFIICVPKTRWPTKTYPPRHWHTVVEELSRQMPVALLGAPGEEEFCREVSDGAGDKIINLSGKTSVQQMIVLMSRAACVICGDSAAQYIALAVDVPAIVLIGPTDPRRTGPYRRGQALLADVPCQGCLKTKCSHITCMQMIEPKEVIAAVERIIKKCL